VLTGAAAVLRDARPMLFLSTHGDQARRDCRQILERHRYDLQPLHGGDLNHASDWICRPK
jgi:hypothetical protein